MIDRPKPGGNRWYDKKPRLWSVIEAERARIGRMLYDRRTSLRLTQEDVATIAMCDPETVADVERGRRKVTIEMLWRLMAAVGVRVSIDLHVTAPTETRNCTGSHPQLN
jgi:transcriptional regulator with XRE-family HTH domain